MDEHTYPYWNLFKSQIADLSDPDAEGWASGSCPYCGDPDTFRVNLKSGRWVCLPKPSIKKEVDTTPSSAEANQ
jgi:hypothetical protein